MPATDVDPIVSRWTERVCAKHTDFTGYRKQREIAWAVHHRAVGLPGCMGAALEIVCAIFSAPDRHAATYSPTRFPSRPCEREGDRTAPCRVISIDLPPLSPLASTVRGPKRNWNDDPVHKESPWT